MASTSTNKQPLLIDRPLHQTVTLGNVAALTTSTDLNTPTGAGMQLLVDGGADGVLLDSVSILALQASITASMVLLFLSSSSTSAGITPQNSSFIAGAVIASATKGQRTNISLPALSVPVPSLASPAATAAEYPSETDKKNTGLFVPGGRYLYAGVDVILTAPSSTARVVVAAQGGYY